MMQVELTLGHAADHLLSDYYIFENITYPLRRVNMPNGESPALVAPVRLGELLLERKKAGEEVEFPEVDYFATAEEFTLPDEELAAILLQPRRYNDSLPELYLLAENGEWRERAVDKLRSFTYAPYEEIAGFVAEYWENLRPDRDNIEAFYRYMDNGFTNDSSFRKKELLAFLYPIDRFQRDATDDEIIADFKEGNEENPTLVYTPDELAESLNDSDIGFTEHWVRFIEY